MGIGYKSEFDVAVFNNKIISKINLYLKRSQKYRR